MLNKNMKVLQYAHSFPTENNSNVQGSISILKNQRDKVTKHIERFDKNLHKDNFSLQSSKFLY